MHPARLEFGPPTPPGPFPGLFGPSSQTENYSSDGFRRTFFNADGTPITPGNFLSTGGQLLLKPELTAADGVASSGGFRFYGDGAAAAHAAAIAALIRSASPTATPTQIRNILQSTALDIMAPGVDRDSGYGVIQALQAVAATGAPQVVNLAPGTVTLTEVGGNASGGPVPRDYG